MNIAFFGTSDRSISILEAFKNSDLNLCLVVTKKDKPVGRKQTLTPSKVKVWAQENGVKYVTWPQTKAQGTRQIETVLSEFNIEIGLVADFSYMIPPSIFEKIKHGIVNIHFSLLPHYRGASPVQFAILNQEAVTGISYQLISKGMDEGPILKQTEHELEGSETSGKLYETLFEIAANEVTKILKQYISNKIKPKNQNHKHATYTYSPTHKNDTHIFKQDAKIDWSKSHKQIYAAIRAYHPWPVAWTTISELENLNTKIKIKSNKNPNLMVKIHKAYLDKNGHIVIENLQVEGKNIMTWDDFCNGYLVSSF